MTVDRRALRRFPGKKRVGRRRRGVVSQLVSKPVHWLKSAMERYDLDALEQTIERVKEVQRAGDETNRMRNEAETLVQQFRTYRELVDLELTELESLPGEWLVFNVVVSKGAKGLRVSVFSLAHELVVDELEVHCHFSLRQLRDELDKLLRHSFTTIACFLDESGVAFPLDYALEEFLQAETPPEIIARALFLEPSSPKRRKHVDDFNSFDDGCGFLTREIVRKGFEYDVDEWEVNNFFWCADYDRDGRVSLDEYIVYANMLELVNKATSLAN